MQVSNIAVHNIFVIYHPKGADQMQPQISPTADASQMALIQKKMTLESRFRNGVNWFFWIAALSLVNTLTYLFGVTITFVIGLGATQIVDGFMSGAAEVLGQNGVYAKAIGLVINIIIAGVFGLFGFLGRNRHRWAIIVGIVFYTIDGIILLLFRDFFGAAFHAWALFGIIGSLKPLKDLETMETSTLSGTFQNVIQP